MGEDMVDMDMDVNAVLPMLNQKLMLTTDMAATEVTVDMDTVANVDLLLLKHLQLLIMDMAVNDDLLSPIMEMEATEDMDTDMDVKLCLENSERKEVYPITKHLSNEKISCTTNNSFISKK